MIERIQGAILSQDYHHFPETTMVVCCLLLKNGFSVVGTASCVNPESFNYEIGCNYAYQDAETKLAELIGHQIRQEDYDNALSQ